VSERDHSANGSYPWERLRRASEAALREGDAAARARARARVDAWNAVIDGMATGSITIGSRTPVADTPAWATLEVLHGGFATGKCMAESALRTHEMTLLETLGDAAPGRTPRERLNLHYLSDEGQADLLSAMRSGQLRVTIPEEGALVVVAWLLDAGRAAVALELVTTLRPWMHRLRFYPELTETPQPSHTSVHVATAHEVAEALEARRPQAHVAAMNEALGIWAPLYDRLVALWLDTVEGSPPSHAMNPDGTPECDSRGRRALVGGQPCVRWPGDWEERREAWLADYEAAEARHRLARKHRKAKSNFSVLARALERCPSDGAALSAGEVSRIRHALAGTVTRHGVPGSDRRRSLRATQRAVASQPLHSDIAALVATRLRGCAQDVGIPDVTPYVAPARDGESHSVAADTAVPPSIAGKTRRAVEAPVGELVRRGVIGSAEVLARVLPQLTAHVTNAGIEDPALRDLFAQVYAAFRRRRSLLLLDLDHQVQLDELPWVAALDGERQAKASSEALARQTLEDITVLTLSSFPETIIPNPMLTEMRALAGAAGRALPFVEEVAADIFMGTFTAKWAEAAAVATKLLRGTLYDRYYDLAPAPEERRWSFRWGKRVATSFADRCTERAREAGDGGGHIARNGAILEQSQILTTQNLAVLVHDLDLVDRLRPLVDAMASRAFGSAFDLVSAAELAPRARLRAVKNAAYAWRHGLFFASFSEPSFQRQLVGRLGERASGDRALERLVAGLHHVVEGGRFDRLGAGPGGGRRFLGWSRGPHLLMGATDPAF